MTQVVIFADTSLNDNEELFNKKNAGDVMWELPTKGSGPYRIATEVRKHGFSCQVVHLFFYFSLGEIIELCRKFIKSDTVVVGLSTTFWNDVGTNPEKRIKLSEVIRYTRRNTAAKIVFGGTLSANFSDTVKADASFDGYSDGIFMEYLKSVYNKTQLPVPTRYSHNETPVYSGTNLCGFDFNTSQIMYHASDCMDHGESAVIETARGCIFRCDFCSYPLNGKKKLDYIKEAETLREELIRNYEEHGIVNYTLSDDTFNDSTYKLERIHKVVTELPFKINFVSYLRLDLLHAHREQISLLKEIGLAGAFFGVETFNKQSGTAIGKGLDPEKQKQLLHDLKAIHWGKDVNLTVGLISGLPYETAQSHQETIDWLLNEQECLIDRIRPGALSVSNPLLDKFPFKSEFQINAQKFGFYWPDSKSNRWKNLSHYVKSWDQAVEMSQEIYQAGMQRHLIYRGNFSLPLVANLAKYDDTPKTMTELLHMDIVDYASWYSSNRDTLINKYVGEYKRKILSL